MSLETKAAFARRLNWNRSTVTRAAQAGRLVMSGNLVDVEASIARIKATEGSRADVAARHAAERLNHNPEHVANKKTAHEASSAVYATENEAVQSTDTDGPGRARYKAITLQYENQQIKLGMAMSRGLRFARKDVSRESTALGAIIRSAVERVIDQTAPRLAVMSDAGRRRTLLGAELSAVRRALRAEFPRALRRLRNASQKAES